jgi:C1A family cysteine protease
MMIAEQNSQNGAESYRLGLNKFSDMTELEFNMHLGAVQPYPGEEGGEIPISELEAPSGDLLAGAVDWRSIMNPVRDQGNCGSCWSFATIASVEGRWAVKRGGN